MLPATKGLVSTMSHETNHETKSETPGAVVSCLRRPVGAETETPGSVSSSATAEGRSPSSPNPDRLKVHRDTAGTFRGHDDLAGQNTANTANILTPEDNMQTPRTSEQANTEAPGRTVNVPCCICRQPVQLLVPDEADAFAEFAVSTLGRMVSCEVCARNREARHAHRHQPQPCEPRPERAARLPYSD